MPHYFNNEPSVPSAPREITFEIAGRILRVQTDSGVFSKQGLDAGSRLLAESLPALEGSVLEIGGGWGGLALAVLAVQPHLHMTLIDINARACELAEKNIKLNGFEAEVICADAASLSGIYHSVLMNPPIRAGNAIIQSLMQTAYSVLKLNGSLYTVIRRAQGAESWLKRLGVLFQKAEVIARDKGYWIIQSTKG
ncbi:MAG: methyltransferase [Clostridia bacterium]|nr:methyltransferase [Clostridia bacterium]